MGLRVCPVPPLLPGGLLMLLPDVLYPGSPAAAACCSAQQTRCKRTMPAAGRRGRGAWGVWTGNSDEVCLLDKCSGAPLRAYTTAGGHHRCMETKAPHSHTRRSASYHGDGLKLFPPVALPAALALRAALRAAALRTGAAWQSRNRWSAWLLSAQLRGGGGGRARKRWKPCGASILFAD